MIRVLPRPEPASFQATVRAPGQAFLQRIPAPTNRLYKANRAEYWRLSLGDLHSDYSEICAYIAEWILIGDASVDHYIPKSANPALAYEWSNFRLCLKQINSNKGSKTIIDPFIISDGWFVLNFDTFFIRPNTRLPAAIKTQIRYAIQELHLNDDMFRNRRISYIDNYHRGTATMTQLTRRAPFIASELRRQRLVRGIIPRYSAYLARLAAGGP